MLFQIAFGLQVGRDLQREVLFYVDPTYRTHALSPLLGDVPRARVRPAPTIAQVGWTAAENKPCVDAIARSVGVDVAVTGYFQSRRFFSNEVLRSLVDLVHPDTWHSDRTRALDALFAPGALPVISLHIRRGDYVRVPDHHPLQTVEYYAAALRLMPPASALIVFSDDLPWARQQTWLSGARPDVRFPELTTEESLAVMARCSHHIIANSSFSWWGAQFASARCLQGEGDPLPTVVAPQQWFGPALAHLNASEVADDCWFVLDCKGALVDRGGASSHRLVQVPWLTESPAPNPDALFRAWTSYCVRFATAGPDQLARLRKDDVITQTIFDHVNAADAEAYLSIVAHSSLGDEVVTAAVTALAEWDSITGGTPTVVVRPHLPRVSLTATKYIGTLAKLSSLGPVTDLTSIIEIGGGVGGMAFMLSCLPNVRAVTVYDLPEVCACIRNVTKSRPNISCVPYGMFPVTKADLLLSEHAWSECPRTVREQYASALFGGATRGWLTVNFISEAEATSAVTRSGHAGRVLACSDVHVSARSFTVTWNDTESTSALADPCPRPASCTVAAEN